jgi:hypothetical protein
MFWCIHGRKNEECFLLGYEAVWRWMRYVPPKHRLLQEPHSVISKTIALFTCNTVLPKAFTVANLLEKYFAYLRLRSPLLRHRGSSPGHTLSPFSKFTPITSVWGVLYTTLSLTQKLPTVHCHAFIRQWYCHVGVFLVWRRDVTSYSVECYDTNGILDAEITDLTDVHILASLQQCHENELKKESLLNYRNPSTERVNKWNLSLF